MRSSTPTTVSVTLWRYTYPPLYSAMCRFEFAELSDHYVHELELLLETAHGWGVWLLSDELAHRTLAGQCREGCDSAVPTTCRGILARLNNVLGQIPSAQRRANVCL